MKRRLSSNERGRVWNAPGAPTSPHTNNRTNNNIGFVAKKILVPMRRLHLSLKILVLVIGLILSVQVNIILWLGYIFYKKKLGRGHWPINLSGTLNFIKTFTFIKFWLVGSNNSVQTFLIIVLIYKSGIFVIVFIMHQFCVFYLIPFDPWW